VSECSCECERDLRKHVGDRGYCACDVFL